jgi:hypothetical protein
MKSAGNAPKTCRRVNALSRGGCTTRRSGYGSATPGWPSVARSAPGATDVPGARSRYFPNRYWTWHEPQAFGITASQVAAPGTLNEAA